MKPRRFTEPQIPGILHQEEDGVPVPELCRLGHFSAAINNYSNSIKDGTLGKCIPLESIAIPLHLTPLSVMTDK